MRRHLLLAGALAVFAGGANAQVLTQWVLFGEPGGQVSTPASNDATGITGLDMTRGPGINPTNAANSISANGWNNLTADDYFSFGFTVDAGFSADLDELWLATRSSGTGPGFLALRSSLDGFTGDLANIVNVGTSFTNTIVDLSALTGITGTIEFRLYAENNVSAAGGTISSAGTLRISEYFDGVDFFPVFFSGDVNPLIAPDVLEYGSGINPAGSLAVLSGVPQLGGAVQLGISNTAVLDSPAAFGFLFLATAPSPLFPAGFVLPGFGMASAFDDGELLIAVDGFNPWLQLGPQGYAGGVASSPATFNLPLPSDPIFAGIEIFTQGILAFPTEGLRIGLTNGLRLTIGN